MVNLRACALKDPGDIGKRIEAESAFRIKPSWILTDCCRSLCQRAPIGAAFAYFVCRRIGGSKKPEEGAKFCRTCTFSVG